jgi:hypothetical protein
MVSLGGFVMLLVIRHVYQVQDIFVRVNRFRGVQEGHQCVIF